MVQNGYLKDVYVSEWQTRLSSFDLKFKLYKSVVSKLITLRQSAVQSNSSVILSVFGGTIIASADASAI